MHKNNYSVVTNRVLSEIKVAYIKLLIHDDWAQNFRAFVPELHFLHNEAAFYTLLSARDKEIPLLRFILIDFVVDTPSSVYICDHFFVQSVLHVKIVLLDLDRMKFCISSLSLDIEFLTSKI